MAAGEGSEGSHARQSGSAFADFEDRREERRRNGLLKYQIEQGVPDVGGLGWRTRQGHIMKNQTYFASKPKENSWNNPTHAGEKTWRSYHGPKLRADAPLMERLDRLDVEQEQWEDRKEFMVAVRKQQLDRFYNQKLENDQKEMASHWAPHRRAKKEVNSYFDTFQAELDSMPMKELKKILTPALLKGDKEAVENITKRVQVEETWRLAWEQMEKERYQDIRSGLEQRMAYNDMLQGLSGQKLVRASAEPPPKLKLPPRLEELSAPKSGRHGAVNMGVTRHSDFKGLVHVDHAHALEARFPGQGREMSQSVREQANNSARPGYAPPPPEDDLVVMSARGGDDASPGTSQGLTPGASGIGSALPSGVRGLLRPASGHSGTPARPGSGRSAAANLLLQVDRVEAPPAPRSPPGSTARRTGHNLSTMSTQSQRSRVEESPDIRPLTYPVMVPTAEAESEGSPRRRRQLLRPRQRQPMSARHATWRVTAPAAGTRGAEPAERWPPANSRAISVQIWAGADLPLLDRSGHCDPYAMCMIAGRPQSRVRTHTLTDTENPVWNAELLVIGWRPGDDLEFAVYDHHLAGTDELLATLTLPSGQFFPRDFDGTLHLESLMRPANSEGQDPELRAYNEACHPTLSVSVAIQEDTLELPPGSQDDAAAISMPNAEPSLASVCSHLDDFEQDLERKRASGNFFMGYAPRRPERSS